MTSNSILGNDQYVRTSCSGLSTNESTDEVVRTRDRELAQRTDFLPGRLRLRLGRPGDYRPLARFHYRAGPPATWARVVCINFEPGNLHHAPIGLKPAEAGRPQLPSIPDGATEVALPLVHQLGAHRPVAIGVLSWPTPTSRGRREVFGLDPTDYAAQLHFANRQLRTISRVIVHPQFRGLGLAGVIIRLLCELCPTRFVEATARMGAIHPMFERAGMTRHESAQSEARPYFWLDRLPDEPSPLPSRS